MSTYQKLVLRALYMILCWCEKMGGLAPIGYRDIMRDLRKALGKDAP